LRFCGVPAHGRKDGLARATAERTSAVVCRLQKAIKCFTAKALQTPVIRECAERCNDRLDGSSSPGFCCVFCVFS
jgi:hypothetical protein